MNSVLGQILALVAQNGPPVDQAPVVAQKKPLRLRDYQEAHCQLMSNILAGIPGRDQEGLEYFKAQTGNPNLTVDELPLDLPQVTVPSFPFAVDTSIMGSGKTYSTGGLVSAFDARFLVIGPPSIEYNPWRKFVDEFELPEFIDFISYHRLAGSSRDDGYVGFIKKPGAECTIPLLVRKTIREKIGRDGKKIKLEKPYPEYTVTPAFKELVGPPQPGDKHSCTFIIFDEFHALKNTSGRNAAASAISKWVMDNAPTTCRLVFLSATPFDKESHARNICLAMGVMRDRILSDNAGGQYNPRGMAELVRTCERVEYRYKLRDRVLPGQSPIRDVTKEILDYYHYGPNGQGFNSLKDGKTLVYRLLTEVIFDKVSSAMPPLDIPAMLYRGFFRIEDLDNRRLVAGGLKLLNEAVGDTNDFSNDANDKSGNFDGRITIGLTMIEKGSVIAMCDYVFDRVKAAREEGKPWKGVIGLNYMESVVMAADYLTQRGGNVIVYAGRDVNDKPTPPRLRTGIVDQFQANDPEEYEYFDEVEFMIVTIASGGVGISFHDDDKRSNEENGGRKRIVVASPDYKFTAIHQFFGRFNRNGSRSVAECYLFYPNVPLVDDNGNETSSVTLAAILQSLAAKAKVTDSTLFAASRGLIKYPGDYPRYIHGTGYVDEERSKIQLERNNEKVFKLVPRQDMDGRVFSAVFLTSNEDPSFGTFLVHEAMSEEGLYFDTMGNSIDGSRYMFVPGDNSRIYRIHTDQNGVTADIFIISKIGGEEDVSFDYPIQLLSADEAAQIESGLRPLNEFNRQEDKDRVPVMVEIDILDIIDRITRGEWDKVYLQEQEILYPDWNKIREIDRIENDIKSDSSDWSTQTKRRPCAEYTGLPPELSDPRNIFNRPFPIAGSSISFQLPPLSAPGPFSPRQSQLPTSSSSFQLPPSSFRLPPLSPQLSSIFGPR